MDEKHEIAEKLDVNRFGFWIYIMSDLMIFASLFATFMVLRHNVAGGPSGREIFEPQFVLIQTLALLSSSLTAALGLAAARRGLKKQMVLQFVLTGLLGLVFLGLELNEFRTLIADGYTWQISGFLSSFFTLVGTHGLHITIGLLWLAIILIYVWKRGLTASIGRKIELFTVFWHFLDIVWIGIFTIVYMFGVGGV